MCAMCGIKVLTGVEFWEHVLDRHGLRRADYQTIESHLKAPKSFGKALKDEEGKREGLRGEDLMTEDKTATTESSDPAPDFDVANVKRGEDISQGEDDLMVNGCRFKCK